ncbi:hypothetical protein G6N74_28125 [Mesorhizobium sp. CGMCC 1.15528]|uniref:Uncharacterized protein n=1 Tax=Mesorhizobium zhangyense TaxID=1776730 RepID=A0A7C9VI44_9HYPH|nr:hypothetical protein [Mesorhizobium zhangyense]NGN44931.1 hypothetical protein [Mesorhizobium zhangyense]
MAGDLVGDPAGLTRSKNGWFRAELDQVFGDQQRQVDEIKQFPSGIYNQRDVIRDILERLDRVERRVPIPPG